MKDMGREILIRIHAKNPVDHIRKELGMSDALLQARIEDLIRQGYLAEKIYASGCNACPFNCTSHDCSSGYSMISLTTKGKKRIGLER